MLCGFKRFTSGQITFCWKSYMKSQCLWQTLFPSYPVSLLKKKKGIHFVSFKLWVQCFKLLKI